MREIRVVGTPRGAAGGAPIQAEALALFQRMTVPPSAAYRGAVNEAIYRWKQGGLWALIKGLWILSADTAQAALLSVIGDTPRDAVAVGALPTFTSLKGFSAFDSAHRIRFPITAAILASNFVIPFIAARVSPRPGPDDTWYAGALIQSDGGAQGLIPGNFEMAANSGSQYPWLRWPGGTGSPGLLSPSQLVFGYQGVTYVFPGSCAGGGGGSIDAVSSNYLTGPTNTPLQRLCAYGFLSHTATPAQGAKFLAILSNMLDELGALD